MPRRPRLAIGGIPWHIIQRGNNRSACFYSEQDYQYYLQTLGEQSKKYDCAIHAYVLGNDRFKDEIESMLKRRVTPGKSVRPLKGLERDENL